MSIFKRISILFFCAAIAFACASSSKYKPPKKLKPGKPIPCPQKDC